LRTPTFWYEKAGPLAWLLAPLGWVYGQITSWHMNRPGKQLNVPVLCVGNFTAGGAGKTPTVALIADLLTQSGEKPFILSRGYGGKQVGPMRIDPSLHRSADCGDEPLLLVRHAPTIIARDRLAGARLAEAFGASVIIMDDGLQSPRITKDLSIAVVDGGVGVGNGFCVPAGPLRAPLRFQWPLVDLILWIAPISQDLDASTAKFFSDLDSSEKPLLRGTLVPEPEAIMALADIPLLAFAGIGRPQKFYDTLRSSKLNVQETQSFSDHHAYTFEEIDALRDAAKRRGLRLVTTEKDAIRLDYPHSDIAVIPVTLATKEQQLLAVLRTAMNRKHSPTSSRAGV
jgi:tetraacyldisaccharide 4'-kinase